jgi:2-iminobutanoate/2-iminopropanoate deaminase
MLFSLTSIVALLALSVSASSSDLTKRENNGVKYLGSQSATLSGGTRFGDLVFVSGQVPLINGTVVPGGIKNETAFVIDRVGAILAEGGSDWSKVLKVTVLLQGTFLMIWMKLTEDIRDLPAMNEVYAAMIPDPKPARAAFEVGNLPVLWVPFEPQDPVCWAPQRNIGRDRRWISICWLKERYPELILLAIAAV